ncbi:cadherin-like domain-containing protein, partial [Synechococcus sp. UW140]|uniref:cadherin-like domain-containing protein n=1 Tax=Synechococcus sp. UW140 TaxID=368503 RepID=UPI0025E226A1
VVSQIGTGTFGISSDFSVTPYSTNGTFDRTLTLLRNADNELFKLDVGSTITDVRRFDNGQIQLLSIKDTTGDLYRSSFSSEGILIAPTAKLTTQDTFNTEVAYGDDFNNNVLGALVETLLINKPALNDPNADSKARYLFQSSNGLIIATNELTVGSNVLPIDLKYQLRKEYWYGNGSSNKVEAKEYSLLVLDNGDKFQIPTQQEIVDARLVVKNGIGLQQLLSRTKETDSSQRKLYSYSFNAEGVLQTSKLLSTEEVFDLEVGLNQDLTGNTIVGATHEKTFSTQYSPQEGARAVYKTSLGLVIGTDGLTNSFNRDRADSSSDSSAPRFARLLQDSKPFVLGLNQQIIDARQTNVNGVINYRVMIRDGSSIKSELFNATGNWTQSEAYVVEDNFQFQLIYKPDLNNANVAACKLNNQAKNIIDPSTSPYPESGQALYIYDSNFGYVCHVNNLSDYINGALDTSGKSFSTYQYKINSNSKIPVLLQNQDQSGSPFGASELIEDCRSIGNEIHVLTSNADKKTKLYVFDAIGHLKITENLSEEKLFNYELKASADLNNDGYIGASVQTQIHAKLSSSMIGQTYNVYTNTLGLQLSLNTVNNTIVIINDTSNIQLFKDSSGFKIDVGSQILSAINRSDQSLARFEIISRLQDKSIVQDVFSNTGKWLTRELLLFAKADDALSTKTTINFTVQEVNDLPTLIGPQAKLSSGSEDIAYQLNRESLLTGFVDVDNDLLNIIEIKSDQGKITNDVGGNWKFTPDLNYNGNVVVKYIVSDGRGGVVDATQTFVLKAVNDDPVKIAGEIKPLTILEDALSTSLGLEALSYGPGGGADEARQAIRYIITELPASIGIVKLGNGEAVKLGAVYTEAEIRSISFTAAQNTHGKSKFSFQILETENQLLNPSEVSQGEINTGVDINADKVIGAVVEKLLASRNQLGVPDYYNYNSDPRNIYQTSAGLVVARDQLSIGGSVSSNWYNSNSGTSEDPGLLLLMNDKDAFKLKQNASVVVGYRSTWMDIRIPGEQEYGYRFEVIYKINENQLGKAIFNSSGQLIQDYMMSSAEIANSENLLRLDLNGDQSSSERVQSVLFSNNYNYSNGQPMWAYKTTAGITLSQSQRAQGEVINDYWWWDSQNPQSISLRNNQNSFQIRNSEKITAATRGGYISKQSVNTPQGYIFELYTNDQVNQQSRKYTFASNGNLITESVLSSIDIIAAEVATKRDIDQNGATGPVVDKLLFDRYSVNQNWNYGNLEFRYAYESKNGILLSRDSVNLSIGTSENWRNHGSTEDPGLLLLRKESGAFKLQTGESILAAYKGNYVDNQYTGGNERGYRFEIITVDSTNTYRRSTFQSNGSLLETEYISAAEVQTLEQISRADINKDGQNSARVDSLILQKNESYTFNNGNESRFVYKTSQGIALSRDKLSIASYTDSYNNWQSPDDPNILFLGNSAIPFALQANESISFAQRVNWFEATNNLPRGYRFEIFVKTSNGAIDRCEFASNGSLISRRAISDSEIIAAEIRNGVDINSDGVDSRSQPTVVFDRNTARNSNWETEPRNVFKTSSGSGFVISRDQLTDQSWSSSEDPARIFLLDGTAAYKPNPNNQVVAGLRGSYQEAKQANNFVRGYSFELIMRGNDQSYTKAIFNAQGLLIIEENMSKSAVSNLELRMGLDLDKDAKVGTEIKSILASRGGQNYQGQGDQFNVFKTDSGFAISRDFLSNGSRPYVGGVQNPNTVLIDDSQFKLYLNEKVIAARRSGVNNGNMLDQFSSIYEIYTIDSSSRVYLYKFNNNGESLNTFSYISSFREEIDISVIEVNDLPTLTGTAKVLADGTEDTQFSFSVADLLAGYSDFDADSLSVSSVTSSGGELINNNNGTYNFMPYSNINGVVSISFNVIDGRGGITPALQSFMLKAINDLPERIAGNISKLTLLEDSPSTPLGLSGLQYSPGGGEDELTQLPLSYAITELPNSSLGFISFVDGTPISLIDGKLTIKLTDLEG